VWTAADWSSHPRAVRICQDTRASDTTADVLDVERGAAANTDAARWYKSARESYDAATRPGQRHPAIYTSAANVTPLVNALKADGITAGPRLWVANWNLSEAQATAEIIAASGPFPIIGVQFHSAQFYDVSTFSTTWLNGISALPAPGGPHRHVLARGETLATVAARRHTTVEHLAEVTVKALKAGDAYYTSNP
jgi:hypothetical protein